MTDATHADPLLSSFDLRGQPLQNRVVMTPMTRGRAGAERIPSALMAAGMPGTIRRDSPQRVAGGR